MWWNGQMDDRTAMEKRAIACRSSPGVRIVFVRVKITQEWA